MKTRQWIVKLLLLVIPILFIGGCKMFENKPTLTKEQQNNVVRWIARGYNVDSVDFTNFGRNKTTGTYMLSIKVNNDEKLGTVYATSSLKKFDRKSCSIGLDPIDEFEPLKKEYPISDNSDVDISQIKIKYLGDCKNVIYR